MHATPTHAAYHRQRISYTSTFSRRQGCNARPSEGPTRGLRVHEGTHKDTGGRAVQVQYTHIHMLVTM